jgi:hypothetical protein
MLPARFETPDTCSTADFERTGDSGSETAITYSILGKYLHHVGFLVDGVQAPEGVRGAARSEHDILPTCTKCSQSSTSMPQ